MKMPMNFFFPFYRPQIVTPDFLEDREYFLPIRVDVLLTRMLQNEQLGETERENLRTLCRLLGDRFHYEYREVLESLKNDFVPFDPDRETLCEPEYTDEQLHEIRMRLYESIRQVLQIGNYRELTPEQFAECLTMQPIGGLSVHVDTGDFDKFHVYYRGVRHREETERFLFFWKFTRPVVSLNRVFVIARFNPENGGRILVKMFKDIPVENIKIIAPKVKLGLPIFARVKIGGSVAGTLFPTLWKLVFAFTMSWIYFCIIVGGLLFAAFKGMMSFLNNRTKYMQLYSSSLYYQNLSNNTAALTTLLDAAETQELKEALLGYYILYLNRDRDMTEEQLDDATERWIAEQFGHDFDFEVDDAVRKLVEKELVHVTKQPSDQPTYRVCGLPEALMQLDKAWDDFNTFPDVA